MVPPACFFSPNWSKCSTVHVDIDINIGVLVIGAKTRQQHKTRVIHHCLMSSWVAFRCWKCHWRKLHQYNKLSFTPNIYIMWQLLSFSISFALSVKINPICALLLMIPCMPCFTDMHLNPVFLALNVCFCRPDLVVTAHTSFIMYGLSAIWIDRLMGANMCNWFVIRQFNIK